MSARLGAALAEYLRDKLGPQPSFVLVEGVPSSVGHGMSQAWDDETMPTLAVVSPAPAKFGRHGMRDVSATQLRNRPGGRGVVLVLCDGEQLPERQSTTLFESVAPSALLGSHEGMAILCRQQPAVDLDGPARAVREAIVLADVSTRPSATQVADYLDRVAGGDEPFAALPVLGAFEDRIPPGGRADAGRVSDNLTLAAQRTDESLLRPSAYADLRKRAERVLSRRPGLSKGEVAAAVDRVMTALQSGSPELLTAIRYDEAGEILRQRPDDLSAEVRRELKAYQAALVPGSQAVDLPWDHYERRADDLRRGPQQREAAVELCQLDNSQQRDIFSKETRRKLERLDRDKSVDGSKPSCPEAAIVRAAQQLGGQLVQKVRVVSPQPPPPHSRVSQAGAGKVLTLAAARLRLGGLMHRWSLGGDIDGLLLRPADDADDLGDVLAAFHDAGIDNGAKLPPLQLRLEGDDRSTVRVDWRPDLDDLALLRATLLFAQAPTLTLQLPGEPTLAAFCGDWQPEAVAVPAELVPLARALQQTARDLLDVGLKPRTLETWVATWVADCKKRDLAGDSRHAEALALVGATVGSGSVALTGLAPLKAEWLAQYHEGLWSLITRAEEPDSDADPGDAVATAAGIARATAAHYPAHLRLRSEDRSLLPGSEGRVWALFGAHTPRDDAGFAGEALQNVLKQLLTLQPEAAGHLRCLAWGPGAADLLAGEAADLIGKRVGRARIQKIEVFCVGGPPREDTLARLDTELHGQRDVLDLRYVSDLSQAKQILNVRDKGVPAVHFALVTGMSGEDRLVVETAEVDPPAGDSEVLFAPRVWQRPKLDRRTLLMPPAATAAGLTWLRLQNAAEESWPEPDQKLRVPEVRTGVAGVGAALGLVHDLALWVATLDRYATRDSLEAALGRDNVAILHQERRLGGDSPLSLVLSQKSGGPADRAIGRSLRVAGIVTEPDIALAIGTELRKVASQGYGILALQAATSGAGINELVGHVVGFSLLATTTTPWPLPPGCRVLLVNLDEYRHWFPGKRADLLAIALDPREGGVHVACIEVKARRSDEQDSKKAALDQLSQTLAATRWAAYPEKSIHSRLWLNRIAEAAYAVARESRFKLDAGELAAIERFRLGKTSDDSVDGTLEWAGVGLVFGPTVKDGHVNHTNPVGNDIVPVAIHTIQLTQERLQTATRTDLTDLRTVETDRPPLQSTRVRRRPEAKPPRPSAEEDGGELPPTEGEGGASSPPGAGEVADTPADVSKVQELRPPTPGSGSDDTTEQVPPRTADFSPPVLGWDTATGDELRWPAAGTGPDVLQNGHVEIWGSSGMGKTQFAMSLLAQLSRHSDSRFGIADFKNDYSAETGFPAFADAQFIDLWNEGAAFNPLALPGESSRRSIDAAVIELRDTVEEAASTFTRMGHRQKGKLEKALQEAYEIGRSEGRWPTLRTLDDLLDADLAGVMGDLTRHQLFRTGPPLGEVVDANVVFGLSRIPGNGQTTVLAAGFILSALLLRIQGMPPVPNTIRYVAVVDEAHRVAAFKAVKTMIREGRSKGLAVVLATQQPLDLPEVVAANAGTKICFGLPDATVATMAAKKLDRGDPRLPEQIRTLERGEAFVSLRGEAPRLLRMAQAWRDYERLRLPALVPQ